MATQFKTMQDLTSADVATVKLYQQAIEDGNFTLAASYLAMITDSDKKLINAAYINSITAAIVNLQGYNGIGYEVSATQPTGQVSGDFWFEVTT